MGLHPAIYLDFSAGRFQSVSGCVPAEETVTLYVNGQPLVSMRCTPIQLDALALGFLFNERLIRGLEEVAVIDRCGSERCVDVWLEHDIDVPAVRTITSGCSGGTTFDDLVQAHHRVNSNFQINSSQVLRMIDELSQRAIRYRQCGGLHVAGMGDGDQLLCSAEDIGRHNALDKVAGMCLIEGRCMQDRVLLTSGRVSSEMISKAARMGAPIVISRTSPTSLSVQLAQAWGITLIGYARGGRFRVYSGALRVRAE
ncbi:MAG: formate dehydrogenase accessory sulfurtransferase FdhD [Chloroflexi bacterium]|nr:formate dehydrogenase accessory sulfurtransferase FdhD [Chloroflexota bacterium]